MTTYLSLYDQRVNLVKDTLRKHSDLNDKAAAKLAAQVLDVLDHLPEKVR